MLDHSDSRRTTQLDLQTAAREAQCLDRLPAQDRLNLTLAGTVKNFDGESVILSEGTDIEEVYLILRGLVTVGMYQGINPALWLYVSGPGTIVDTCALLDPPVSPVTIRALTDVEVLAIPRAAFVKVIRANPDVGYELLQNLCSRLSLITRITLKEFIQGSPGPSLN